MTKQLIRGKSKKGQTLVEYALILALISAVGVAVMISFQHDVRSIFSKIINSSLASAQSYH